LNANLCGSKFEVIQSLEIIEYQLIKCNPTEARLAEKKSPTQACKKDERRVVPISYKRHECQNHARLPNRSQKVPFWQGNKRQVGKSKCQSRSQSVPFISHNPLSKQLQCVSPLPFMLPYISTPCILSGCGLAFLTGGSKIVSVLLGLRLWLGGNTLVSLIS
jgi:hypothetical protein